MLLQESLLGAVVGHPAFTVVAIVVGLGVAGGYLIWVPFSLAKAPFELKGVIAGAVTITNGLTAWYAWNYYSVSSRNGCAFSEMLSRPSAAYFAITTLATTGYGDIYPKNTQARLLASSQMIADLALLTLVIALLIGRALASSTPSSSSPSARRVRIVGQLRRGTSGQTGQGDDKTPSV